MLSTFTNLPDLELKLIQTSRANAFQPWLSKKNTMSTYPRTFSHIGISVPDLEKAAKFYSDVMGWYHIMEPTVISEESDTPIGQMCIDV